MEIQSHQPIERFNPLLRDLVGWGLVERRETSAELPMRGEQSTVGDQLVASVDIHAQSPEVATDPSGNVELSSLGDKLDVLRKSVENVEDSLDRFEHRTRERSAAPAWDYDSYDRDVGLDDGFGL